MNYLNNIKNSNKYIFFLILLFFLLINSVYFYLHLNSLINVQSYSFNELFINYQAGFIRRGLLGEIIWQLNKIFFIEPRYFFCIFFL